MYEMLVWLSQNDSEDDRIPLSLDLSFLPDCEPFGFQQDVTKLKLCVTSLSIWVSVCLLPIFRRRIKVFRRKSRYRIHTGDHEISTDPSLQNTF